MQGCRAASVLSSLIFCGTSRIAWQLMAGSGPGLALPKAEKSRPGLLAMAGTQWRQNLSWVVPQTEPAGLCGRAESGLGSAAAQWDLAWPYQALWAMWQRGAWPSYWPVTCSKARIKRFSWASFIFRCVFTELYSAFLSGLTGCQCSNLASWLVLSGPKEADKVLTMNHFHNSWIFSLTKN